ncbi:MAG: YfhO family protein [Planctomycetaceae bacterium]|jgi:hypothetical protein|nr:YfhO family protein [Planctomycetaceae bacterium]
MKFYHYIYVIFVIILFFCFNGGVPAFRDGVHFYRPMFWYICEEVALGRFPFWNPYENLGQPFAANPTSLCFYPITILAVLATTLGIDRDCAYSFCVGVHVLIAVFTCYRFIRISRLSRAAAVFAGLSYGFSGAVLFQWNNLPFLIGAAWLPEALRQVKIIIDGNRNSVGGDSYSHNMCTDFSYKKLSTIHLNIIALAAAMSMLILGGDPQTAYNVIICIVFFILFFGKFNFRTIIYTQATLKFPKLNTETQQRDAVVQGRNLSPISALVYFLFAGLLTFLFAAIQILPTVEFLQLSDRTLAQHNTSIDHFSFQPLRIFEFLFSGITGKLFPINSSLSAAFLGEKNLWTPTAYVGLFPAIFALCSIISIIVTIISAIVRCKFNARFLLSAYADFRIRKRHKIILVMFAILIFFLFASFGDNFLFYRLLWNLPAYNLFRYPSKLLTIVTLAISFFAAVGFDTFGLNKRFAKFTVVMTRIIVAIYSVFVIFICCNDFPKFASHPLFGSFDGNMAKNNLIYSLIIVTINWFILECIFRYIFFGNGKKYSFNFRRIISGWCLIIILTIDLFIANSWLVVSLPFGDNRIESDVLKLTKLDNEFNVTKNHLGKNDRDQIAPIRVYRIHPLRYPPQFNLYSSANRIEEIVNWEQLTLYPRHALVRRIAVIDVRGTFMHKDYYWAMAQIAAERKNAEKQNSTGLFERHLRQLGVEYIIAERDSFSENIDFNADKIFIDSQFINGEKSNFIDNVSIWRLGDSVPRNYVLFEPNRIIFDVEVSGEIETVAIAEQYWRGWRAYVGGNEIPVKVVRKIFRAVELPKGKHRVTMIYDPPLIKIGGLITLAGIFVTIIICVVRRKKRYITK